jgi:hypothetical protein
MAYTAHNSQAKPSREELVARIPGWGVDLDPKDRPSVPQQRFDPGATGAHWDFPERQPEHQPRERSIEHAFLTPVFGTSAPLHGASGALRRLAYRRYSEARAAHWLLLVLADRVDATGAHVRSLATIRPDNPITQTGVLGEFRRHPIRSRVGRTDLRHAWMDPIIVAGPWVGAAAGVALAARRARRALRGH